MTLTEQRLRSARSLWVRHGGRRHLQANVPVRSLRTDRV